MSDVCAVIKLNTNMAVAYIDMRCMWLSLAIKIVALSTQLHWSSCYMHWEVAGIGK
jgi:hypothetical protein